MKTCTKCGEEKEATTENFDPRKKGKDGLCSWCRECRRGQQRHHNKSEQGKIVSRRKEAAYRNSIHGNLMTRFNTITFRCQNRAYYLDRGTENRFESATAFTDHVLSVMKIEDPRELHCHRIDNEGHYEPGNIEFLTAEEHANIHNQEHRMATA